MTRIAAIILAGGRGNRLGGIDKARLRLAGRPLIAHVLDRIRPQADAIVLAGARYSGRNDLLLPLALDPGANVDGPMAGIIAGALFLEEMAPSYSHALTVAVDTPAFPTDFVPRALQVAGEHHAVLAGYDGQLYPTNALWTRQALVTLLSDFARGQAAASPRRFADRVGMVPLDWFPQAPTDPFSNINTLKDLMNFERRQIFSFF